MPSAAFYLGLAVTLAITATSVAADFGDAAAAAHWPRSFPGPQGGRLVLHQPQVDDWKQRREIEARAAVEVTLPGVAPPVLGAIWVSGHTSVDLARGLVHVDELRLLRASFPGLPDSSARLLEQKIAQGLAGRAATLPLASLIAAVQHQKRDPKEPRLSLSPPQIFSSAAPAILVVLDGEPVLIPLAKTGLEYVVNTNWNLFRHRKLQRWFLLDRESWLEAPAIGGPWIPARQLPNAFNEIPDQPSWQRVRAHLPGKRLAADAAPRVLLSTRPAELILTQGPPQFAPIEGTRLRFAENTPNDLFFDGHSNRYYVLFGGRWFRARTLQQDWSAVAGRDLPPDFAKIPPESPRGRVLVAVPGTSEAQEAVLVAEVPQTATIVRKTATVRVSYAGPPKFQPVPKTDLYYAVNTPYRVIRFDDHFYLCHRGIWFESISAEGLWRVAVTVPLEIYMIPPESPLYPVTYVYVYSSTPTTVVVGYTVGYMGTYVYGGSIVYGTGYYYPPYYWPAAVPVYIPYPRTYSAATWYNQSTGAYGRGAQVVGPYGAAGVASSYNPETGTYAHGAAAYGPNGGAGRAAAYNPETGAYAHAAHGYGPGGSATVASGWNPNTGTYAATTQHANEYAQWGNSVVSRDGKTVQTSHYTDADGTRASFEGSGGSRGAAYHSADGGTTGVAKSKNGDVYAGHDGNLYRHGDDGWQAWDDGSWEATGKSAESGNARGVGEAASTGSRKERFGDAGGSFNHAGSLSRDRSARRAGAQGFGGMRSRVGRSGGAGFRGGRRR